MTQTMNTEATSYRVLSGGVQEGDFIQYKRGTDGSRTQWFKVLSIIETARRRQFVLQNKAGIIDTRTCENWDKIYGHPWNLKHNR